MKKLFLLAAFVSGAALFPAVAAASPCGQYADFTSFTLATNLTVALDAKLNVQCGNGAPTALSGTAGIDAYVDIVGGHYWIATVSGEPATWKQIDTSNASSLTSGTLPHAQLPALVSADIPNNAASTSGNAATATALAAAPTLCSSGQAPTGVLASGNATGCAPAAPATNGTSGQGLTSNGGGGFSTPVTLAPSATTDTTNASNITSGTLPHARLPALVSGDIPNNGAATTGNAGTASALASTPSLCPGGEAPTGVLPSGNATGCASLGLASTNGTAGQGLTTNGLGGFGTPITLAPSATTDTTNASNITSGTLLHARLPALVSGDIPNNAAATSGNAATATALAATPTLCTSGQAPTGVLPSGNATGCAAIGGGGASTNGTSGQGLTSNGSGGFGTPLTLATSATTDTTNASNIASGTLGHARLPALVSADIPNNAAATSGNAATATALAATPTLCTTGQAPTGVLPSGNATGCAALAGGGTVTSVVLAGTANQIAVAGTCTITATGTCTFSLPTGLVLPGTIDGLTITTTTGTLTISSAKVLTVSNSLTLAGTDNVTLTFPSTNATIARTDASQTFGGTQTFTNAVDALGGIAAGSSPPTLTPGTGGVFGLNCGTAPSVGPAANVAVVYCNSTLEGLLANFNNAGYLPLTQGPASVTTGHLATWTSEGVLADGGAAGAALTDACGAGKGSWTPWGLNYTANVTTIANTIYGWELPANTPLCTIDHLMQYMFTGSSYFSFQIWNAAGTTIVAQSTPSNTSALAGVPLAAAFQFQPNTTYLLTVTSAGVDEFEALGQTSLWGANTMTVPRNFTCTNSAAWSGSTPNLPSTCGARLTANAALTPTVMFYHD